MKDVYEYYLTGGKIKMGKKELTLELLRNDSILRRLLGKDAGNLNSLIKKANLTKNETNEVIIDLSGKENIQLEEDPAPILNVLKSRYGNAVGGKLHFKFHYITFDKNSYLEADLESDKIVLRSIYK